MKNQKLMIVKIALIFASCLLGCTEDKIPNPEPIDDRCINLFPPQDIVIQTHTSFTRSNYIARIKVFQSDTIAPGDIVMLGNSLTEQGGNWSFKLGKSNVKNRGISGDNTDGVLARLNELLCMKPSIVFIMIGTNDLFLNYSPEKIVNNIDSIGSILAIALPESRIIVQTIMPLGSGNDKKSKLIQINDRLRGIENKEYELLDTYQFMINEEGDLPESYTYDGVHLTPEGYSKWVQLLKIKMED